MPLPLWLSMVTICVLGAISPGPSLAVVVRNTVAGGRAHGLATALSHAAGISLWALLTAAGIGFVIIRNPALFDSIRWAGALVLLFLGGRYLLTRSEVIESLDPESSSTKPIGSPFRDGFLIAVTNPKIALFLLALFSQFVRPHAGWGEKIVMVVTAGTIDTLWYAVVALALSHSAILSRLRRWAVALDRIFGLVLIALAIRVAI